MAFSAKMKPKAAAAPPPPPTKDEDSDEVESVGADEDAAARKAEAEAQRLRRAGEIEEEAKRAKEAAEAKEKERKAAEEASRQKAATEAARRREAAEEARRKAEEDKRRREEYEYEKARQETIARSKREAAKRAGGGGFGGGGFGGGGGGGRGGGGGSFAWKKPSQAQGAGFGGGGGPPQKADPRRADMPSHDECEMGISAMISRTSNGMKEGLQMLGLPNFPLTFIPGQAFVLCGHDLREGINEMIHNWMTDEKDDFFACLAQLREITSRPILTQEEVEMMEKQEDWVQIDGPDGKPRFTKRDPAAKREEPEPAPKPAAGPPPADDDSGDEVIDIVPGGPAPTSTPAPPPAPAARPAPALAAAPVPAAGAEEDFYGLLGVAPDATLQEIRTKFRSLVVTEHPEKGGDPKKFQKLNKAYSVLSDQKKRREYDAGRGGAAPAKNFVD